jgi:hypothetical protein
MDMVTLATTSKAAHVMLDELASDILHSIGVCNEEKSRFASKCYDIQGLLGMGRRCGKCTR